MQYPTNNGRERIQSTVLSVVVNGVLGLLWQE